jgi:iron complex transport system substrate-binding protein
VIDRGQVVGGGLAGAKATLDNELMHQTKAWKTGHIIYLSPSEVYVASGGIQALNITLDQLTDALKSGS